MTAAKLSPITAERLLANLPRSQRRHLPRVLSERRGASLERSPTIEAALVTLEHVGYRASATGWDPEWAAKMPEMDPHYAVGWRFACANYGATADTLHVYVWRPSKQTEVRA